MKTVTYQKILVTHDGSELASSALPHAKSIAQMYNAEVILLRVVVPLEVMPMAANVDPGVYPLTVEAKKREKRDARSQLEKIRSDFEDNGIPNVITYVEEGLAQDVIIDIAKIEQCDMIVMSTHGRSGIIRTILGSVTDYVVRHSSCPVLVVRPQKSSMKGEDHETEK